MKKCITLLILTIPVFVFCQSISADKLISYSKFQDLKIIANDLDRKGFITNFDNEHLGAVKTEDSKTASEVIYCEIVTEKNIFSVVYQTPIYYDKIKKELINSKSKYLKTEAGITFYDNATYRTGFNDSQKTIAIYTKLK